MTQQMLESVYAPAADEGTLPMRLMSMNPLPTWSAAKCLVVTTVRFCFPGVTTACDMGAVQDSADAWDTLERVYVPAADEGTLPMRLMAMVPLPTWSALKCLCLLLVQPHMHHIYTA